jgi:putative hemolysin
MTNATDTPALSFWERQEERFQKFVHRTRTDSFCLSIPGLHRQVAIYCLEMLLDTDRLTREAIAAHRGKPRLEGYRGPISAGQFLEAHAIGYEIKSGSLENIPKNGPVIFVANHPHGVVEPLIGAALVMQIRKDLLALANFSLLSNPIYGPYVAPIDFREGRNADRFNLRSIARFRHHIKSGGAGIVAPAGAVATRTELAKTATDSEWRPSAAKWARLYDATVVPFYFEGDNSPLFHIATKMNMVFRLGVMALENYRLRKSRRRLAIGTPISPETLRSFPSAIEATQFLREQTFGLREKMEIAEPPAALEYSRLGAA